MIGTFGAVSVMSLITAGVQLRDIEKNQSRRTNTSHGGNYMSLQSAASGYRVDAMKQQSVGHSSNYSPLIAKQFVGNEGSSSKKIVKTDETEQKNPAIAEYKNL